MRRLLSTPELAAEISILSYFGWKVIIVFNLRSIVAPSAILFAFATAGMADSVAVDLSSVANGSWCGVGLYGCTAMPTGTQTYNGDTFDIGGGGNTAWFSTVASGNTSAVASVTIQVNVTDATTVKTLMNTLWGQSGASYDTITFNGSMGSFSESLTGDNSLRDYNNYVWTNSVVAPTTVAWTDTSQRLDEQVFSLGSYSGETLNSITITDTGADMFSRAFLAALTVDTTDPSSDPTTTPEPSYLAFVGAGLLGVGLVSRRKRAQ